MILEQKDIQYVVLKINNMKRLFLICLLFLMCFILSAQKLLIKFNVNVIDEINLLDSTNKIYCTYYYNNNGELEMSLSYKDGKPNGKWNKYKNGNIVESISYVDGKLNGDHTWFDDNKNIIKIISYNKGVRTNNISDIICKN